MNENEENIQNIILPNLLLVQAKLANPEKNQEGYSYKYATLDSLLAIIKPILAEHDCGLYQHPVGKIENDCLTVKTVLFHKSGQHLVEHCPVPIRFKSNPSQDFGAAFTYGRRYALMGLMNIFPTDEDTDGVGSPEEPDLPPEKPDLVTRVQKRIESLEIAHWAKGTKFDPERVSELNLERFLNMTDQELKTKVADWEKKNAG